MLEIEMKFPVTDFARVQQVLAKWQVQPKAKRVDCDRYYNAPDRDFAQTDEALRIRSIGARNFVTYKGPKIDAETKTRTEIELPLGDGPQPAQQMGQVLQHLGYRFVAEVRKERISSTWQRDGYTLEFCLDTVVDLGHFVEIEITAPEEELPSAKAVVLDTARDLGLEAGERRSYLEMLLETKSQ